MRDTLESHVRDTELALAACSSMGYTDYTSFIISY